jgi:guanosine-diphosphatase
MKEAVRVVPEHLRRCTPVAVKATAGLRLLPQSQSDAILKAVEKRLEEEYPFKLHGGVEIMDGKDEGVYAWITANYLLDNFSKGDTLAVLDLGGASTQIVFEPTFADKESKMVEGEHKYELKFGGKKYELYQHSYLGYGLMRARMSVHKLVNFLTSIRAKEGKGNIVGNPCLARGTQRVVSVTDDSTGAVSNVTMSGEDIGGFESCNRVIELVMAKDA